MRARFIPLAVLLAATSIAVAVPTALALVAIALPLLAVLLGPRLETGPLGQAVLTSVALGVGLVAARYFGHDIPPEDLTQLSERATLLAFPILGVAALRAVIKYPRPGPPATLGAALIVLAIGGRAITGWIYPVLCTLFLACAALGMAYTDPGRVLQQKGTSRILAVVLAVVIAGGFAAVATVVLPDMQDAATRRLLERWRRSRVGFSDRMTLGALDGLLANDRVMLRIRGKTQPRLLRGVVFSRWLGDDWQVDERIPTPEVVEVDPNPPTGAGWIEIEHAAQSDRYFLPLEASDIRASSGFFKRDLLGICRPIHEFHAKRIWFRPGGGRAPYPPLPSETVLPHRFVAPLSLLLVRWGAREGSPTERLARIEAGLRREYRYSLDFDRTANRDPLLDFLYVHREGHCEYFASAMALLGRATGIPTRVVGGYRVVEVSPLGYSVVRQRHAHAWVEAWVDGVWVTFDPTPPVELAESSPQVTPWLSALVDGAATTWEAVDDWLARRTPFELSLLLAALSGALLVARSLRRARRRRHVSVDPPLPGYSELARALQRHGIGRGPSETLDRFADRVRSAGSLPEQQRTSIAQLIRTYAALRYAGQGEPREINVTLRQAARRL